MKISKINILIHVKTRKIKICDKNPGEWECKLIAPNGLWKLGRFDWFAFNGQSVHDTSIAMVVVDGEMQDGSIVPNAKRTGFPGKPARKFGPRRMVHEEFQNGAAFFVGQPRDPACNAPIGDE